MSAQGSREPGHADGDEILCAVCGKLCDGLRDVMVHAPHGNYIFCDFDCADTWKMHEAELGRTGMYHWSSVDDNRQPGSGTR